MIEGRKPLNHFTEKCSFANGIHGEADELIDRPFVQRLDPVIQDLYEIDPKDFHTEPTFLGVFC